MKKCGLLALLLALALLLTGCAQDEAKKLETNVIRVGNVAYTYGELLDMESSTRAYYDEMAQLYALYGIEAPVYTDEDIRNEALNTLAMQAVVLDKANQMGLDVLTASEKAEVSARTDASMAEYRASAEAMLTLPEDATEAEKNAAVDQLLAESGITRASVYKAECQAFIIEKTEAWAVSGVTVSEEEFTVAFNEQVETDKASMADDPTYYGLTILNGQEPLYAPAGYREVEWILLDYTDEDMAVLSAIDSALYAAQTDMENSEAKVKELLGEDADLDALTAQVSVTLNDVTDPAEITVKEATAAFDTELSAEAADAVIALAKARALETAYEDQLALANDAANAALAPEAEEVLRRLTNGEEWSRVQEHYNDDVDMYYGSPVVCADFGYVPEAYVEAAMKLQAPGEWSEAVYVDGYGCFIIRYVGDVAEGPVDPATVRESMTAELLSTKQEESFSSTLDIWWEAASKTMVVNYTLLEQ